MNPLAGFDLGPLTQALKTDLAQYLAIDPGRLGLTLTVDVSDSVHVDALVTIDGARPDEATLVKCKECLRELLLRLKQNPENVRIVPRAVKTDSTPN